MSFILDALKRAEAQRASGNLPNMATPAFSTTEKRSIPWLWVAIVILLLIIAIGLWFRPGSPTAPETTATTPIPAVTPARALAPIPAATMPKPAIRKPAPKPIAKPIPTPRPVPKIASNQAVQIHGQVRHEIVPRKPTPVVIHKPVEAPAPIARALIPVEPTPAPEPAEKTKYERLTEQDIPFRQSFPKFTINVHVSADTPSDRFVLVNFKRFNEGDKTPAGVQIEEITLDGVAVNYRGRTVLVPPTGNP